MDSNKNAQKIELHYSGTFEKNDKLTARTVGNGLINLQRIIDKAVLFAKKGVIKKGDALPSVWYEDADMQVGDFEKGCVTIPLKGPLNTGAISLLKGVLHEPYQKAISDEPIEKKSLLDGFDNAINRANYRIDVQSHEQALNNISELSNKYFAESIYKDFNNLISPLRSSKSKNTDLISIELFNNDGVKEFEFNKETSKRFNKIISQRKLGDVITFTGRLTGLVETNNNDFPYKGTFYSSASKNEHTLLIRNESQLNQLRNYVAAKQLTLSISACPIVSWGAFDIEKGDLVYMKMDSPK
jgi:hypothetical protein